MDIAVLFGEVGFISHKKMIDGILEEARKHDDNVFLYTCDGWKYMENEVYGEGEFAIFSLPDLSKYAGVIVDLDSIHDKTARELILSKIKETGIPCISMNIPLGIENSQVIQLENVTGIRNMVEHLVKVHGVRSIHFISGPTHNRDALKRRDVFCNSVLANGLTCGPEDISYGDFQYHSGQRAIAKIVEDEKLMPRAFIAANDQMAIGAMLELDRRGYSIPEDVIVMGYDDSEMSRTIQPRLSTVHRDEVGAGRLAVKTLNRMIAGEKIEKPLVIKGQNIFSESCGCHQVKRVQKANIIMGLTAEKIYTDNNLETLKSTTIAFSNMLSFSQFTLKLQKYVEQMELDYFYLCIGGDRESYFDEIDAESEGKDVSRDTTKYTDKISIPLAYERGEWHTYPEYNKCDLLPKECCAKKKGAFYIVMPVHYGNYCIGYCVVGNYRKQIEQRFIQHLVLSINNALGNIRENDLMEAMLARINKKWIYDELTGIYNRAGFSQKLVPYIEKAHEENKKIVIYFIDLDGLKKINDRYGHEEGDRYIKSMADILKNYNESDIVARYGGDEYIVMSSYESEKDILSSVENINQLIKSFNENDAVHKLSASIGYQMEESYDSLDIRKMIELADKEMYESKRLKHSREEWGIIGD